MTMPDPSGLAIMRADCMSAAYTARCRLSSARAACHPRCSAAGLVSLARTLSPALPSLAPGATAASAVGAAAGAVAAKAAGVVAGNAESEGTAAAAGSLGCVPVRCSIWERSAAALLTASMASSAAERVGASSRATGLYPTEVRGTLAEGVGQLDSGAWVSCALGARATRGAASAPAGVSPDCAPVVAQPAFAAIAASFPIAFAAPPASVPVAAPPAASTRSVPMPAPVLIASSSVSMRAARLSRVRSDSGRTMRVSAISKDSRALIDERSSVLKSPSTRRR